mmetsp:Transcript_73817/g.220269  ORF Transcript_73817/g.220269 Transcript_73817/m.220269 type:complete len:366 (-) Transcript_73817:9-1106(-)
MCDLWTPASVASTASFSESPSSLDVFSLVQKLNDARAELASLEASAKRHREVLKLLAPFVFVAGQPTLQLGLRKVLQHGWNSVHWAQGYTLLHYVGENGDDSGLAELVACLAESAAEVEEPDEKGRRPLDYARANPCEGVLAALEHVRRQQRSWQDLASPSPARRSRSLHGGANLPPLSRGGCGPAVARRGRARSSCGGPLALPWGAVTESSGPERVEGRARMPASACLRAASMPSRPSLRRQQSPTFGLETSQGAFFPAAPADPSLPTLSCAVPSGASSAAPRGTGGVEACSLASDSRASPDPCEMGSPLSSAFTSVPSFGLRGEADDVRQHVPGPRSRGRPGPGKMIVPKPRESSGGRTSSSV